MSKSHRDPFQTIDAGQLANVAGGASRVTARTTGNDQLTQMMTQLTQSLQQLQNNNNQSDPMEMMMMMMMMMGRMGGGGAAAQPPPSAPAPQPQAPVINISTTVKRHGW